MDQKSGKLIQQVIIPIAVLVAVAMSVVVGFVWFSAKNQDRNRAATVDRQRAQYNGPQS